MSNASELLLEVKGLKTHFIMDEGTVQAVEDVGFSIRRGQTVGVVGESGCGKSVTAYSILQLIEKPGKIIAGQIQWHRKNGEVIDLARLKPLGAEIRRVRGGEISIIFQETIVSLSMVDTVGFQIIEAILLHQNVTKDAALKQAIQMLGKVGIPNPEERVNTYPFQLSGGMRQRVMIDMALVCQPALLIADEPTSAHDVTTQAQILELMNTLQQEFGMAIMIITQNLGVVAETCEGVDGHHEPGRLV